TGKLDEAIVSYRTAIGLAPGDALPHHNLGNALRKKGKLDEAIASYRQAIRLDPRNARAHGNLGVALGLKGEPNEAGKALRRAIALEPRNALAHADFKEQPTGSRGETVISRDPRSLDAHMGLGMALLSKRRFDEAIDAFREVIRRDPQLGFGYLGLGTAL